MSSRRRKSKLLKRLMKNKVAVVCILATILSCSMTMYMGAYIIDKEYVGIDGANGKSAYEIAVENGFSGTVEDWLESLKGTAEGNEFSVQELPLKVTVGQNADYETINEALEYLSAYYPMYKQGGVEFTVEIQGGTIINEQIMVDKIDLSYITITTNAPDNTVKVDVSGWGGVTHDTRGNRPFFSAENGGRLPAIGCLFSCIAPKEGWNDNNYAVGYFCNRGSTGVIMGSVGANGVLKNVGLEGFYDNVIANNNSEIVLREAICRNAARYGVLSRHISRVSARSADLTNCGDIAAYADRASMMDVRHADMSGSGRAIVAYHASTVTANEANANNMRGSWTIDSRQGSIINCQGIKINGANSIFHIDEGGTIIATGYVAENIEHSIFSSTPNETSKEGIIYN